MSDAPYAAVLPNMDESFLRRTFKEESIWYRTDFQRDRDRIVHSRAFRRLEYKTQVFINHLGDNFRTRLTHSIEVSQIARTVARALRLNEDLCETLALAHDLGHPPFGHAGERTLHRLLQNLGGFDHNEQSLRIVEILEERYPQHVGLNLTYITCLGLRKHENLPDGMAHSLEAMIVDTCDEIAYNNHDIDDGLESGLLTLDILQESALWQEFWQKSKHEFPQANEKIKIRYTVRNLIGFMVSELISSVAANLQKYNINNFSDVISFKTKEVSLVAYPQNIAQQINHLKKILYRHLYKHPDIEAINRQTGKVIERLYYYFFQHTEQLPLEYRARIEQDGVERSIADFIAGMTDRYALTWSARIRDPKQSVLPLEF